MARRPARPEASALATAARSRDAGTLERRADEVAEERRRPHRARLELRVELAGDEPRVVGQLDDLDEPALLVRARDDEARVDEPRPEVVVDLVAMPVALVDDRLAVRVARPRALGELDRLRAEPHRAAEILDLLLLGQQVDHRIRRLGIHLGRVRAVQPDDVPRELGDGDVHARGRCRGTGSAARGRRGRRGSSPPSRASRSRRGRARRRPARARGSPPRATCPRRRPSAP